MVRSAIRSVTVVAFVCGVFVLSGCSNSSPGPSVATTPPGKDQAGKGDEHGHKPAAHGGIVVPIGSDSYHAEAVFEKGGQVRLYLLGQNEAMVLEVEKQALTGYARLDGGTESEAFALTPAPQPGDREGMTSLFLGQLPKDLAGKKVEVTIPAIRIGKERFRLAFQSAPAADPHAMPAGVAGVEEKKLYLTPGGMYTEADIKANGGIVPSLKFKGVKAEHDLHPKAGDKICPITLTRANARFTWVVGGKAYEFCCPPCIDEFVATAKDKPGEIQPPDFYRKK